MTTQEELLTPIGEEVEKKRLQPATVVIKQIEIEEVGKKNARKAVFLCIHPDAEDLIRISEVKWLKQDKLEQTGLWYNKDSKGMLQKGSALAGLIVAKKQSTLYGLMNQSIETVMGNNGYLCFKNY